MSNSQNCPPLCTFCDLSTLTHCNHHIIYIVITIHLALCTVHFWDVRDTIAVQVCVYSIICLIFTKTISFASQQTKIIYTRIVTLNNFCNHYKSESVMVQIIAFTCTSIVFCTVKILLVSLSLLFSVTIEGVWLFHSRDWSEPQRNWWNVFHTTGRSYNGILFP